MLQDFLPPDCVSRPRRRRQRRRKPHPASQRPSHPAQRPARVDHSSQSHASAHAVSLSPPPAVPSTPAVAVAPARPQPAPPAPEESPILPLDPSPPSINDAVVLEPSPPVVHDAAPAPDEDVPRAPVHAEARNLVHDPRRVQAAPPDDAFVVPAVCAADAARDPASRPPPDTTPSVCVRPAARHAAPSPVTPDEASVEHDSLPRRGLSVTPSTLDRSVAVALRALHVDALLFPGGEGILKREVQFDIPRHRASTRHASISAGSRYHRDTLRARRCKTDARVPSRHITGHIT